MNKELIEFNIEDISNMIDGEHYIESFEHIKDDGELLGYDEVAKITTTVMENELGLAEKGTYARDLVELTAAAAASHAAKNAVLIMLRITGMSASDKVIENISSAATFNDPLDILDMNISNNRIDVDVAKYSEDEK